MNLYIGENINNAPNAIMYLLSSSGIMDLVYDRFEKTETNIADTMDGQNP